MDFNAFVKEVASFILFTYELPVVRRIGRD